MDGEPFVSPSDAFIIKTFSDEMEERKFTKRCIDLTTRVLALSLSNEERRVFWKAENIDITDHIFSSIRI